MIKFTLTVILLLSTLNSIISQSNYEEYTFIVDKLCEKLKLEKYINSPPENILNEALILGKEIGKEHSGVFENLLSKIRKDNQAFSDKEVLKVYLNDFAFLAIENCPQYLEFTLRQLGKCPEENELFIILKNETDRFIVENSKKNLLELNNLTMNHIVATVMKNKDLAKKYYTEGIEDPIFFSNMNSYLYNKSRKFLQLTILIQIEKMVQ